MSIIPKKPFKEFGEQNYGIGYFSPDNCTDIDIKCEYKRTPSFYSLKKAYAQVTPENITLDDFTPSESRTGRTECPPHFPRLDSYHWNTDLRMSLSCPSRSADTWTCPASNSNSDASNTTSSSSSAGEQHSMNLFMWIGLVAFITFVIIKSIIKKKSFVRIQSLQHFEWNAEKDAKSNSTDDDDEEDDDSDESSALVGSTTKDGKVGVWYDSLVTKLNA